MAAVASCALGMGCKAVMITAPFVVALYDRVFLSRSFAEMLRRRWVLYAGLAMTILGTSSVLRAVLFPRPGAAGTVGLDLVGTTPLGHALTQPGVILHYLSQSLWPQPLCLDYDWPLAGQPLQFIPQAFLIGLLVVGVVWALRGRPWLGFSGAWFFLILSPTSSVMPIQDQAVEHRMYLPLAGVVVVAVVGGRWALLKLLALTPWGGRRAAMIPTMLLLAILVILGGRTILRNRDYHSSVTMWSDNAALRPYNARVRNNLGSALWGMGKVEEAIGEYRTAIRLGPSPKPHNNLGVALKSQGKLDEAIEEFRKAIAIQSGAEAHNNLGVTLKSQGKLDEAVAEFQKAIAGKPYASGHFNLGNAFRSQGKMTEAIAEYRQAAEADGTYLEAIRSLASVLEGEGLLDEAVVQYRRALRIEPDASVYFNLGNSLARLGRLEEAVIEYRRAVALSRHASAHFNLGNVLRKQGKMDEAIREYRKTTAIEPHANAHKNLGRALMTQGKEEEAEVEFRKAAEIERAARDR